MSACIHQNVVTKNSEKMIGYGLIRWLQTPVDINVDKRTG